MELMAVYVKFQKFFNVLMINSHQPEVVSSYEKCLCIENIHKVNTDWHTKRMQMKNSMEDAKKKSEDQDAKILEATYSWKMNICIILHNTYIFKVVNRTDG